MTTIGGVLVVPGQLPCVFGSHVPGRLVSQWGGAQQTLSSARQNSTPCSSQGL